MRTYKLILIQLALLWAFSIFAQDNGQFTDVISSKLTKYRSDALGYSNKLSVDQETGIVYYSTSYRNYLIQIDSVKLFRDYLVADKRNAIKSIFNETVIRNIASTAEGGLITDIELPIKLGKLSSFLGEGGRLVVEGSERVDFAGSKTFLEEEVQDENYISSWFSGLEIEPKQHLIVNVTGTVGDRIRVNLKHNSETSGTGSAPADNKVKIEYNGSDDDILQTIEAGDIDLSLPGIKLIGGPPAHKGLFGVKSTGQLGGLHFTVIASKETGESQSDSFSGNTKQDSIRRYDTEYVRNRFYYIPMYATDSIIEINVYRDDGNGYNNERDGAVPGTMSQYPGTIDSVMYTGFFNELKVGETNDYVLGPGNTYIELLNEAGTIEAIGLTYIVKRGDGSIDTVGTVTYETGDTLRLLALKQKEDVPGSVTWNYMMRNIYSFNASNIVPESFTMTIRKVNFSAGDDYEIENGKSYISLLGLDGNSDGSVDLNYINFTRGYVMFPQVQPFADPALAEPDTEIYYTDETSYDVGRLYYMDISYRGVQSVYSLGVFNILEGSEVVTINGEAMVKDVDYTIDYEYGIITFLTDKANSASADIKIDYQYAPFLSFASKNLLGLHLDYEFSDNFVMNSNWLYHTLSYRLEDYPRLGEEPQEALVGEFDLTYNQDLYGPMDLINKLPFYNSVNPVTFSLSSKAGMSYPNPNSTGKAYIDNMESVLNETNLSTDRKQWHFGPAMTGFVNENLSMDYLWHNSRETMGDINDQIPDQDKSDDVNILNVVMHPNADTANTFVTLAQTISKTGMDMSDMKFLQVWVKGDNGELVIDMGKNIPEDMLRRDSDGVLRGVDTLNTEDANLDGILDADEDTGLDGVQGTDGQNVPGDDGNDDYYYDAARPDDYSMINGTENNDILDTEDRNGDWQLNTDNDVYRFRIDLSSSVNMVYRNDATGWKLYRIPLNDPSVEIVGNPDLKYIKYGRMVWSGISRTDTLQLYQISAVSNRWKNIYTINSPEEKFWVGAKSNQTDTDYFPPFEPGYDLTGKPKKEQSMVMYCTDFNNGEGGKVFRTLSQKESYERYQNLNFYTRATASDSLDLYLKFGGDSLNYYFIKVRPALSWTFTDISLQELVELKRDHQDTTAYEENGLGFFGSPSLTNIAYIEFVVMNNSIIPVTTEIWLDEIMLSEPKREIGIAGDVSSSLRIPELAGLDMSASYQDPFFKKLTANTGSGSTNKSYRVSGNLTLDKFAPEMIGLSMPLSASYNKNISEPFYKIGSDYLMSQDEIAENSSYSNSFNAGGSLARKRVSTNKFIHYLFDNMSASGNYANSDRETYNRIDSTYSYSGNVRYTLNNNVTPFKLLNRLDFYAFPSSIGYTVGYSRSRTAVYSKTDSSYVNIGRSENKGLSRNFSLNYRLFRALSLTFNESRTNDPDFEETGYLGRLGVETAKSHSGTISFNPVFIKMLTHNFNMSVNYGDSKNPRAITTADSSKITGISNNGRFTVSGYFDYPKIIKWVGSWRDENRDSTYIPGSPGWIAKYIDEYSKIFSPLNYSYSLTRSSSYSYVSGRAPLIYQTGLVDTVPSDMLSSYTQFRNNSSNSYSLSSGVNLSNISLNASYSFSTSKTGFQDNLTENQSKRWPNLSLYFNGAERFLFLNRLFKSLTLRTSYGVSENISGKTIIDPDRITTSTDRNPVIGVSALVKGNVNINYTYSNTKTVSEDYGTIQTIRVNDNDTHSASVTYAFNAPSGINVPFINKKIKFTSNLNLSMDFSYSHRVETDVTNANELSNTEIFTISPKASYNFSNNVTGGLNTSFSRSYDRKREDARRSISLGIWALFRF